jgi:hypothetical protein
VYWNVIDGLAASAGTIGNNDRQIATANNIEKNFLIIRKHKE